LLQFYFLSVLLNLATGLILVYGYDYFSAENEDETASEPAKAFYDETAFRIVLLILTGLVGLLKLVANVHIKDDYSVVGDLLPVLAGLLGCASLFVEYYYAKNNEQLGLPEFLNTLLIENRKIIGWFCIGTALIHFVLPRVMFL